MRKRRPLREEGRTRYVGKDRDRARRDRGEWAWGASLVRSATIGRTYLCAAAGVSHSEVPATALRAILFDNISKKSSAIDAARRSHANFKFGGRRAIDGSDRPKHMGTI